jgi:tRNA pseudouridine55 synthase
MDGLLVIDKPAGPTSHDVVARMRHVLRERRIGHTGTLDPLATGVLPLVIGRATRLARFLSASEKTYEATIRLGVATDSGDCEGSPVGTPYSGEWPTRNVIDRALDAFRGQFLQHPPAFSARKVDGHRSYRLARGRRRDGGASVPPPSPLRPQLVCVPRLEVRSVDRDLVALTLDCSAGFYVRALARDLGEQLGTGAHLAALRRTRAAALTVADALTFEAALQDPGAAVARVVPLGRMLTHLPAITLDADGIRRAIQGRDLAVDDGEAHTTAVRLLDPAGDLVAMAEPSPARAGLLHPSVVLK